VDRTPHHPERPAKQEKRVKDDLQWTTEASVAWNGRNGIKAKALATVTSSDDAPCEQETMRLS
jgi:hypothetical protein